MNDEKYKKFFYNNENLENIYNILKGEEKELRKENVKKLIQDFEGIEYVGKNIIAKIMSQVTSPAAAMEQAIFNRCKIGDEKYLKAITSPLYNKMDVTGKINWIKKNIPYRMYGKTDDVIHEYIGSPYELEGVIKAYRANVEKYYSDFRYETP